MGGQWWVEAAWNSDRVYLVSWVFWLPVAITLHELAHGWVAIKCGDRTPIETGHMTLNPYVHMGPMSSIAFVLFGLAWGQMPVSPSRFRGHYDDLRVSAAGPMVNAILAVICGVGCGVWVALAGGYLFSSVQASDTLFKNVQTFLNLGCSLNVALVILNLLPIPPLDGSRILANLSPDFDRLRQHPNALNVGMMLFALVFIFGSQYLWAAGRRVNQSMVDGVLSLIAPGAV